MRYSTNKDDKGYENFRLAHDAGKKIAVFLNGHELDQVNLADEEEGLVEIAIRDTNGNIFCDEAGNVVIAALKGKVEVRVA